MQFRILVLFLILTRPLWAFDFQSEYRGLPVQKSLIDPARITSEYQLDDLTARWPDEWSVTPEVAAQTGEVKGATGPLSATRWFDRMQARLEARLGPHSRLRVIHIEEQNAEEALEKSVVEILTGGPRFRYGVNGNFSQTKAQTDFGIFAEITGRGVSRFFLTWQGILKNDTDEARESFVKGSEPLSYGFVSRSPGNEFFLIRESASRTVQPNQNQEFLAQATSLGARHYNKEQFGSGKLEWQLDRRQTAQVSASSTRSVWRDRLQLEIASSDDFGSALFEVGIQYATRFYFDENSRQLIYEALTPLMRFDFKNGLGIDFLTTRYRAWGDLSLAGNSVKSEALESRMNLKYRVSLSEVGELTVGAAFDLDGSEGYFVEGGFGHFAMAF